MRGFQCKEVAIILTYQVDINVAHISLSLFHPPPLPPHRMTNSLTCTPSSFVLTIPTRWRLTTSVWRVATLRTTGTSFLLRRFPTPKPRSLRTGMTEQRLMTPKLPSQRYIHFWHNVWPSMSTVQLEIFKTFMNFAVGKVFSTKFQVCHSHLYGLFSFPWSFYHKLLSFYCPIKVKVFHYTVLEGISPACLQWATLIFQ